MNELLSEQIRVICEEMVDEAVAPAKESFDQLVESFEQLREKNRDFLPDLATAKLLAKRTTTVGTKETRSLRAKRTKLDFLVASTERERRCLRGRKSSNFVSANTVLQNTRKVGKAIVSGGRRGWCDFCGDRKTIYECICNGKCDTMFCVDCMVLCAKCNMPKCGDKNLCVSKACVKNDV
jgi:hypothetical protein